MARYYRNKPGVEEIFEDLEFSIACPACAKAAEEKGTDPVATGAILRGEGPSYWQVWDRIDAWKIDHNTRRHRNRDKSTEAYEWTERVRPKTVSTPT